MGLGRDGSGQADAGKGDIEDDEEDEHLVEAREYFLRYVDTSPYLFLVLVNNETS